MTTKYPDTETAKYINLTLKGVTRAVDIYSVQSAQGNAAWEAQTLVKFKTDLPLYVSVGETFTIPETSQLQVCTYFRPNVTQPLPGGPWVVAIDLGGALVEDIAFLDA